MATRILPSQSNPFGGGAVIFDSAPYANLYLQQQQRELAKDEALDKYFQDWDKSINPAGMRQQDTEDLINLMNENKSFYFQNKKAIKNPALDNGRAYNEWYARNKEASGLVNRSKEVAQKEELINRNILQAKQKGLPITDRVLEDLSSFRKSLRSGQWRDFNPDNLDFQPKPFDPMRFTKDIFGDVKFGERLQSETKVPETKTIRRIYETYMPNEALPTVQARAAAAYKTSPSVKEFVDSTIQNSVEFQKLNSLFNSRFGKNIENTDEAAAAVALSFSPVGKTRPQIVDDKEALEKMRDANIRTRQRSSGGSSSGTPSISGNIFDTFGVGQSIKTPNFEIKDGLITDNKGQLYNGKDIYLPKNKIPAIVFSVLKAGGLPQDLIEFAEGLTLSVKDGRIQAVKGDDIGVIDRQAIENYQLKFNTEPQKGQQMKFGGSGEQKKTETKKKKDPLGLF